MIPVERTDDEPRYPTFDEWVDMMVLMLCGVGWSISDADLAAAEFGEGVRDVMDRIDAVEQPTVN